MGKFEVHLGESTIEIKKLKFRKIAIWHIFPGLPHIVSMLLCYIIWHAALYIDIAIVHAQVISDFNQ